MNGILYLKIDKNIQVSGNEIRLGDVASVKCSQKSVENCVKQMSFPEVRLTCPGRYVFSILEVIDTIHREYPDLEISNLGEADFIITMRKKDRTEEGNSLLKTVLACMFAFFGAAFSIMAFNNDAGVTQLFYQLYESITGNVSDGFTVLEVSYSIGIGLGILIFFQHFSKKESRTDPSPLEVEMRTYEDKVDSAVIESGSR